MLCDLALSSMQQHVQTKTEKKTQTQTLGKQEAWRHILLLHGEMMREQRTCDGCETHHIMWCPQILRWASYLCFDRAEGHLNFCNRFQRKVKMLGWVFWCHSTLLAVNVHGSSNLVVSIDMFSSGHFMAFLTLLKSCVVLLCCFFILFFLVCRMS